MHCALTTIRMCVEHALHPTTQPFKLVVITDFVNAHGIVVNLLGKPLKNECIDAH